MAAHHHLERSRVLNLQKGQMRGCGPIVGAPEGRMVALNSRSWLLRRRSRSQSKDNWLGGWGVSLF